MYAARWYDFFADIMTTLWTYDPGGRLSRVNCGDYGYEVLGSFTGNYEITVNRSKCEKTFMMRIENSLTVASLSRIPETNIRIIPFDFLNPVHQIFAYDLVKPLGWTGEPCYIGGRNG